MNACFAYRFLYTYSGHRIGETYGSDVISCIEHAYGACRTEWQMHPISMRVEERAHRMHATFPEL